MTNCFKIIMIVTINYNSGFTCSIPFVKTFHQMYSVTWRIYSVKYTCFFSFWSCYLAPQNPLLLPYYQLFYPHTHFPETKLCAVHFLASLCQKKSKQNVNSANRLSNSSLCVAVMFPPKTSALCARVRNDRSWREKRSTRSSLPAAMSVVVEQALLLS